MQANKQLMNETAFYNTISEIENAISWHSLLLSHHNVIVVVEWLRILLLYGLHILIIIGLELPVM